MRSRERGDPERIQKLASASPEMRARSTLSFRHAARRVPPENGAQVGSGRSS